jgi:hypothetical protein
MANALLEAMPDEPVLQSNALATVTSSCVVIRTAQGGSQSIISLSRLTGVRRLKTTYPGLLVIAAALFLIAAAAFASKEGEGAQIPAVVLGLIFLIFYFGSRKASVICVLVDDTVESAPGTLREAAAVMKALAKARSSSEP